MFVNFFNVKMNKVNFFGVRDDFLILVFMVTSILSVHDVYNQKYFWGSFNVKDSIYY